ncbi:hypothetical protein GCM10011346_27210 [Oceanobacillus neutriphilus]|uniref:DUF3597 domain-containing protein n=1 Tax=Oceanobacillus neutriphilus TaxID=531815 RepID=A0ABQ2NWF7_9BACI|nr:hypothetical protein GCM10011346_27210 [Oceanobacillus neutriphilus]
MPAILTENGFIDHASDAAKLKSDAFLEQIALGHARGIARVFQLSSKSGSGSSGNSNGSNNNTGSSSSNAGKTNSIVDYLKSIGKDSSFSNRSKLAKSYGIQNYKGTAAQNTRLLNAIRSGGGSGNQGSSSAGDSKTNSIVDYLKSIGEDSSFTNRSRLANSYGIQNYKGTAAQNMRLLKAVRSGGASSSS